MQIGSEQYKCETNYVDDIYVNRISSSRNRVEKANKVNSAIQSSKHIDLGARSRIYKTVIYTSETTLDVLRHGDYWKRRR